MDEPKPTDPPHFYKYRSLDDEASKEFTRQIILEDSLYWTSPLDFNDPFDCAPVPTMPKSRLEAELRLKKLVRTMGGDRPRNERRRRFRLSQNRGSKTIERHMRARIRDHMGRIAVCSLSELPDNILMWSHYAASHRGVCLRFTPISKLLGLNPFQRLKREDTCFELALPVKYQAERPRLELPTVSAQETLDRAVLTKADFWSYEKEWRMLDVYAPKGPRKFPPQCLDAVILGARISDANRQIVLDWIGARATQTQILEASFDETLFRLNIG